MKGEGRREMIGGVELEKRIIIHFQILSVQNEPPRVDFREWRLRPFNYDNTINAMLTLFVVTTGTFSC